MLKHLSTGAFTSFYRRYKRWTETENAAVYLLPLMRTPSPWSSPRNKCTMRWKAHGQGDRLGQSESQRWADSLRTIKSSIETARRITRPAAARPSGDEVSGGASSWEGACGGPRCWWSNRQCGVVTGSALSEDLFFTGTRKESCNWRISHVLTRSSTAGVVSS